MYYQAGPCFSKAYECKGCFCCSLHQDGIVPLTVTGLDFSVCLQPPGLNSHGCAHSTTQPQKLNTSCLMSYKWEVSHSTVGEEAFQFGCDCVPNVVSATLQKEEMLLRSSTSCCSCMAVNTASSASSAIAHIHTQCYLWSAWNCGFSFQIQNTWSLHYDFRCEIQ